MKHVGQNMKYIGFLILGMIIVRSLISEGESDDRYNWPGSAEARVEDMANVLRKIKGPARWCYLTRNPLDISDGNRERVEACLAQIEPIGPFMDDGSYIKRFYGASLGSDICEVTLSTVWGNDRIVGSDCYYGLFNRIDYEGPGMTDDPFG